MTLHSFDIFDTTLYRKCGKAENVFWLLALRLFPGDAERQYAFFVWRRKAARHDGWGNDFDTIKDIYNTDGVEYFSEYSPQLLMEAEMLLESEMLTANPEIVDKINALHNEGNQIAFISDMYLPSALLKDVLVREGAFKDGDRLYVSCEQKARKDDGALYDLVRNELQPSEWHHYGDNMQSDIEMAKKKGIETHVVDIPYTPIELQSKNEVCVSNYQELRTLAGISRHARIRFGNDVKATFPADFVSPCYVAYVMHVLKDAKRRGIKTLYFLSRDSYILLEIAKRLPHDGLELRYLFVSRKSLTLPYLYKADRDVFLEIQRSRTLKWEKISNLCDKVEIDSEEQNLPFEFVNNDEERQTAMDVLFSDAIYRKWQAKAEKTYQPCVDYLRQEGVFDDDVALVDVGWLGSTRLMINSLRERNGRGQLFTYYFGVENIVYPTKYGAFDSYIKGVKQSGWACFVVEDYLSACHYSTTVGYERQGDKVVPLFKDDIKEKKNPIEDVNLPIVRYVTDLVAQFDFSDEALYAWAVNSFAYLSQKDADIDYSFFAEHCVNTNEFTMRKLTRNEIKRYIQGPESTTNIEVALDLTFGRKKKRYIKKIRQYYIALRGIYWKLTGQGDRKW